MDILCHVECKLTIDNVIESVLYNGEVLEVSGPLSTWEVANSFGFKSCDRQNPGSLIINGSDYESGNNCYSGGFIMHCTASDPLSPWNNFVSDRTHWRVNGDLPFCSKGAGWLAQGGRESYPSVEYFYGKGAEEIWINAKEASFIGSPGSP